jgi:SOS response regulatory protein OraA/RecX
MSSRYVLERLRCRASIDDDRIASLVARARSRARRGSSRARISRRVGVRRALP